MEDLDSDITQLRATVDAMPEDHPDRAEWLDCLGSYLSRRYERAGDLHDLAGAILYTEAAVEAIPKDHPDSTALLCTLGVYLWDRFKRAGNLQDLETAINRTEAALKGTSDGQDYAQLLHNLGTQLRSRFEKTGDWQDLETATNHAKAAVKAVPEDHPHRPGILNGLGYCFGSRYNRTTNLQDLETAIDYTEKAVKTTSEDHPDRPDCLNSLSDLLATRHIETGNLQDLEAACNYAAIAVATTPEGHPDRASRLSTLNSHLICRYQRTGNLQDLEAAVNYMEEAVAVTPENDPNRADRFDSFMDNLARRFDRTGDLQDLEAAISYAEAALEAIPRDYPGSITLLSNLSVYMSNRFERAGNLQDLETAINHSKAALKGAPDDQASRAIILYNLGTQLHSRYNRAGNWHDLDAAISYAEAAVKATPDDHPDRALRLHQLGTQVNSRYERNGNWQDLRAAVDYSERALKITPEGHPKRAGWLSTLGRYLDARYERTDNLQDLVDAISYGEAAVKAAPIDRTIIINNLGNHLSALYSRTGNLQDLEAAISYTKVSLRATPQDDIPLNNLGRLLGMRYQHTGNLQDLEAAINHTKAAVEATSEDHPDRARWLLNVGNNLSIRHQLTGNLQDLYLAIDAWVDAWSIPTALMSTRIQAASLAAKMLLYNPSITSEDLSKACSLLCDATHLIPIAISRSLEREDQQHIMGALKASGLVSLACSALLQAGQSPLEALRLQERGRSVTNSQLLDYRSDISDLMEQQPTLAKDFDRLRQELDPSFPSIVSSVEISTESIMDATRRRNKVANDLDSILQQIRQKPGFESFLRADSEEYLLSAAQEGPIVILNATRLRSDAILLTNEKVISIPLPQLSHTSVLKHLGTCSICGTIHDNEAKEASIELTMDDNEAKRELLEWLWKAAVQPVLQALGFYPDAVDPLPRIWWIGIGLLAKAPVHAAARRFKKGSIKMSTLRYCLPSYTSTIRALQYSRSRQCQQNKPTLVVTMPTTPGEGSLPGVTREAGKIKHSLRNFSVVDTLNRPSAECVLQALPGYNIAHFACHGVSSINPADSHLLLLNATGDIDKLRVKDIAALKLPAARLAYLSACNTANSTTLADEVTHIVSSFHIAGFTKVIGTLWPAEDEACHKMAEDFYSTLSETDNVAESYRHAVLELMKQKPLQPMYWAPFIHFGS